MINLATWETICDEQTQKLHFYLLSKSIYGGNVKCYFANIFTQKFSLTNIFFGFLKIIKT